MGRLSPLKALESRVVRAHSMGGYIHPREALLPRRGSPAGAPFAQPSVGARAGPGRGEVIAGSRLELAEAGVRAAGVCCRLQAATRCRHRATPSPHSPFARALVPLLPRLPQRTFLLLLHPLGANCLRGDACCQAPPSSITMSARANVSAVVRFHPGNFKSFDSLSRVLFIFRSRYLFAIGLGYALYYCCASLGWVFYQPCSDYIPK